MSGVLKLRAFRYGLFLSVLAALSFVVVRTTEARTDVRLRLDTHAAKSGYTVSLPDASAFLGIFPGVLSGASRVVLTSYDEGDAPASPSGFERVTPYAGYLLTAAPAFPSVPPAVSLAYDSVHAQGREVHIAFYAKNLASWRFVPSTDVSALHRVRTWLPFRTATFAGFVRTIPPAPAAPVAHVGAAAAPVPNARAAAVMDVASGTFLYVKNGDEALPLASMTKLVTADTALEYGLDLDRIIPYGTSESATGATVSLAPGDTLSVRDALYSALVPSANNAARLLAHATGLSEQVFAQRMIQQTRDLGLATPTFVEPTGLSSANRSSAKDFAHLAQHSLSRLPVLQATTTSSYGFQTRNTHRTISFRNTNGSLTRTDLYVTGSKTGYLPASWGGIGSNLVMRARSAREAHNDVIVVVMGEPSRTQAIADTDALLRWAFANYQWNP